MKTKIAEMAKKKSSQIKHFPERTDFPKKVIGALADAFGKDISTITRWIDNQSHMLTSDLAKSVYAEEKFIWNPEWVLENKVPA